MSKQPRLKLLPSPIKSISFSCPKTSLIKFRTQTESRPNLFQAKRLQNMTPGTIFIQGSASSEQPSHKQVKSRSVCLFRDAVQNKDWLQRAKEKIIQELSLFLNASNCLAVELPAATVQYKYYLSKGNNSALIKQCMSLRPWWVQVEEDQINSAHFVWTQFKNSEHFLRMPVAYDRMKTVDHSLYGRTVTCSTPYEDFTNTGIMVDISGLGYDLITKSKYYLSFECNFRVSPMMSRIQNKLQHNQHLADKKYLYRNMKEYYLKKDEDVFEYLPLTFHVDVGSLDYILFLEYVRDYPYTLWIVKPGENTNRGTGIFVTNNAAKVIEEVADGLRVGSKHSFIIQKYVEKPFLIKNRKFDIRLYTLVTCINGIFQAYFYQEGYLRTASKAYNPNDLENKFIHLTNDAIQNKCDDYGKFEGGNKLSYHDFQRYLDSKNIKTNFTEEVLPKIKKIVQDTIKATWRKLNPERRLLNFEVFGYDFLLDASLKPWLLEVNTNPCLELSSTNLARIIPAMIENALKISIDPLFPEPRGNMRKASGRVEMMPENKFELIFHQYFAE
jgi:hypothetical protein